MLGLEAGLRKAAPDGLDQAGRARGIDIEIRELRMITERGLVNPAQPLVRRVDCGRFRQDRSKAQVGMPSDPLQHQLFLVHVVWVAGSPVQMDGIFVTAFEQVLDPILALLDSIPAHFDAGLAPDNMLDLMAAWLGYDLDDRYQVPGMWALGNRGGGGMAFRAVGTVPHWMGIFDDKGRVMVAIAFNNDLGGKIRVSVVATGIEADVVAAPPTPMTLIRGRSSSTSGRTKSMLMSLNLPQTPQRVEPSG